MKLFWGSHTCAIGTHILLEETGKPYETEKLDVSGGETHKAPFNKVNPKGKVPTLLRDDGSVLTEFGAIATWLARTSPEKKLLPSDPNGEAHAIEVMDYIVGTIHGQGFGRIFKPEKFEPPDVLHKTTGLGTGAVKAQGGEMVEAGFSLLDEDLGRHRFAAGDAFSIADAALFYVEHWAPQMDIELPPNVASHFERMRERPSVRRSWRSGANPDLRAPRAGSEPQACLAIGTIWISRSNDHARLSEAAFPLAEAVRAGIDRCHAAPAGSWRKNLQGRRSAEGNEGSRHRR
jgi:glutathione S-transferase